MGEAIAHGLAAVGRLALMPELALDLMIGVRLVARGYSNQTLKLRARAMAEGFATEWQRATPVPSGQHSVAEVRERLAELTEAERLGQPHPALAVAVRRAAASMPSATLLGMDPRAGPPRHGPTNALWRAWAKALVRAYAAARAGVMLEPDARVAALLHWLPALRAHYASPADGAPRSSKRAPILRQFELIEAVKAYDPTADEALLNRAYVYAMKMHGSQLRASGDPYFAHPIQVAGILTDYRLDTATIVTALLHDVGHLAGLEAGHAPGMDGCGTEDHEAVGGVFVAFASPAAVADVFEAFVIPHDIASEMW